MRVTTHPTATGNGDAMKRSDFMFSGCVECGQRIETVRGVCEECAEKEGYNEPLVDEVEEREG